MHLSPVSNSIRRLGFDAGEIPQQTLADEVGVTRQTILAIEASKYAPSLGLAFRIACAFGQRLEGVFRSEPPKSKRARKA